jgi:hypothetical protein
MLVEYDGEFPNLCRGRLFITTPDGVRWDFGKYSLISGGSAYSDKDSSEKVVKKGPWTLEEWPENFPEDKTIRTWVLNAINVKIRQGCCGGCL